MPRDLQSHDVDDQLPAAPVTVFSRPSTTKPQTHPFPALLGYETIEELPSPSPHHQIDKNTPGQLSTKLDTTAMALCQKLRKPFVVDPTADHTHTVVFSCEVPIGSRTGLGEREDPSDGRKLLL